MEVRRAPTTCARALGREALASRREDSLTATRYDYEVSHRNRLGHERVHRFTSDEPLARGSVVLLEDGRHWLIEEIEEAADADSPARAIAKPARYRLVLRHPDERREVGALRRHRPGSPRLGHAFTTTENGATTSWAVVDERLARDEAGEPFLELVAERDFAESEGDVPDHELEHTLARRAEDELPESVSALFDRAARMGQSVELVALEPGEAPEWDAAGRFVDALVIDEIADDLLEQCGVDPDGDPREQWLPKVQERLREDLRLFRRDVEGDHDQIEEWDFRGGRVFAATGRRGDESDPASGYGWMCRLVDADALGAGGFVRVRKTELV